MKKGHITELLNIKATSHRDLDFIDINPNKDLKLFIDPCLIETQKDEFSIVCQEVIQDYFNSLCKEYSKSKHGGYIVEHLGERNEARLGYGNGKNGKAKTADGMDKTLSGLHNLLQYGVPMCGIIDVSLMMKKFAEDCMSDMLLNVLYKQFSEFTISQCKKYNIQTSQISCLRFYWDHTTHSWQEYKGQVLLIDDKPILLIPKKYICKRYYYSTEQYFMTKIATTLQNERTISINGKDSKPNKNNIRKDEITKMGSLIEAARWYTIQKPFLLEEYHKNMHKAYCNRVMKDNELDKYVYNKQK